MAHWSEVSSDPTSEQVIQFRAQELERAWIKDRRSRTEIVVDACRGRRVVDIGCVDHTERSVLQPSWLHQHIAKVAETCIGLDVHQAGVEAMRAAGYDAIVADVASAAPTVASRGPVDIVVAGELIEHLGCPEDLLSFAAAVLPAGGDLLLTTPNPFALHRVRAGQLRIVWENVDHVTYLFPSGVAELAARNGFTVASVATVNLTPLLAEVGNGIKGLVKAVALRLAGRTGPRGRLGLPLPPLFVSPLDILLHRLLRRADAMGETAVYLLTRNGPVDPPL